MTHSFKDESVLDVREYITTKQALYVEAGEKDQDLIVRRLHDGLDPTLAAAVTLKAQNNTMNDFTNKVYSAEHQARAQYNQIQSQITAQGQELKSFFLSRNVPTNANSWTPKFQQQLQQYTPPSWRQGQMYAPSWSTGQPQTPQFAIPAVALQPAKVGSIKEEAAMVPAPGNNQNGQQNAQQTFGGSQPRHMITVPAVAPQYGRPAFQPYQQQNQGHQQNGYRRGGWNRNWNGNNRGGNRFDNRQQQPITTLLVDTEIGLQEYALVDQDTYESYYQ